ncbi:MAG: riboflavin synthase [Actinomycetota bacterium]|nr:riboflavin synthase [Actinomycetota bacterium]
MFTGIVEQIGTVSETLPTPTGRRLVLRAPGLGSLRIGASIAVNGVCLTTVEADDDSIAVDVIPETLSRTNLGQATPGARVNLERPMRADGRFDGHIVQGHVDGTGSIHSVTVDEGGTVITVAADDELMAYVVEKGSVTLDGVSLTVADVGERTFSVALIPHTLEVTTLGLRSVGDTVNLETDVLAKYVERLTKAHK